jgi:hypothetical protein
MTIQAAWKRFNEASVVGKVGLGAAALSVLAILYGMYLLTGIFPFLPLQMKVNGRSFWKDLGSEETAV